MWWHVHQTESKPSVFIDFLSVGVALELSTITPHSSVLIIHSSVVIVSASSPGAGAVSPVVL